MDFIHRHRAAFCARQLYRATAAHNNTPLPPLTLKQRTSHPLRSALPPGKLQLLDIRLSRTGALSGKLKDAVLLHARPAALEVRGAALPAATACQLSQLQSAAICVSSDEEALQLGVVTACRRLPQLRWLALSDDRKNLQLPDWFATSLPGLEHLPLRHLSTRHCLPRQAWACPQLTSLAADGARVGPLPAALGLPEGGVRSSGLRQLALRRCRFEGGCFPAPLCAALAALTRLQLLECGPLLPREEAPASPSSSEDGEKSGQEDAVGDEEEEVEGAGDADGSMDAEAAQLPAQDEEREGGQPQVLLLQVKEQRAPELTLPGTFSLLRWARMAH